MPDGASRTPAVAVVVLNWNMAEVTLRCLESLRETTYPNLYTIVVDNASTDGSYEAVRDRHPEVELIRNPTNLGYAGGNNVGIARALERGADHLFVINNDTAIPPDCVATLVAAMEADPLVGQVAPLVVDAILGCVGSLGGDIDWAKAEPRLRGMGERDHARMPQRTEVDFIPGAAVLCRADAVRQVGEIPDHYFLYFEDVDWSLRFQGAGWKTIVEPRAQVLHWESSSTARDSPLKVYYYVRNNLYFIRDWVSDEDRARTRRRFHYKVLKLIVKRVLRREPRHIRAMALGHRDFRRGVVGKTPLSF